ncbi:hypothetical protein LY78DRAFT_58842 [Colletotrichum sublineola]|nr:hypothetical protein LY78DRAFT_58842 [Colletotrichum sublineola]
MMLTIVLLIVLSIEHTTHTVVFRLSYYNNVPVRPQKGWIKYLPKLTVFLFIATSIYRWRICAAPGVLRCNGPGRCPHVRPLWLRSTGILQGTVLSSGMTDIGHDASATHF